MAAQSFVRAVARTMARAPRRRAGAGVPRAPGPLGDRSGAAPDWPVAAPEGNGEPVPPVERESTIDGVVRAVCAHAHARLLPAIDVPAAMLDADTVHDGRVAARRARSDLRTL